MFKNVVVRKLTEHRGSPRLYLDIAALAGAAFTPGTVFVVQVHEDRNQLVLITTPAGDRTVSSKIKNNRVVPVIDVNNQKALSVFDGIDQVRVVMMSGRIFVMPLASALAQRERLGRLTTKLNGGQSLAMASLAHGGGVMSHAAHAGFRDAGVDTHAAVVNEIDEKLMAQSQAQNEIWVEGTIGLTAPMQEIVQDAYVMDRLPRVDVLEMGIPCSGASKGGVTKRGLSVMEQHPEVGHLIAPALMLINKLQPAVIVAENVKDYSTTGSSFILRNMLRDMGYDTVEVVLDASDFGCLEARVRWFMVAVTRGLKVDLERMAPTTFAVPVLRDSLEEMADDDERWRPMSYLKDKEVRDRAKANNGFKMQFITPESTSVPTLRKRCWKMGSTDPLLRHPTNPDLLRKLTAKEHGRAKQIPPHLFEGICETDAHELMGQSVAYEPVKRLFHRIGECMLASVKALKEQAGKKAVVTTNYALVGTG